MAIELIDGESKDQRSAVLSVFTLAFARDPMMRWLYPEPEAYLTHFPEFAAAFGGPSFSAGTAWASEDTGGAAPRSLRAANGSEPPSNSYFPSI
jgi:hypothetical protein